MLCLCYNIYQKLFLWLVSQDSIFLHFPTRRRSRSKASMRNDKSPSNKWWPRKESRVESNGERKKKGTKKDRKKSIEEKGEDSTFRRSILLLYCISHRHRHLSAWLHQRSTLYVVLRMCSKRRQATRGNSRKLNRECIRELYEIPGNARQKKEKDSEECRCKKWRRTSSKREEVREVHDFACELRRTEFTSESKSACRRYRAW